jgi:hypothetical protein
MTGARARASRCRGAYLFPALAAIVDVGALALIRPGAAPVGTAAS